MWNAIFAQFYIAEKGNKIYWYSQNHISMKHNKCNWHGWHKLYAFTTSAHKVQFKVKSVSVRTGIMLIHKRMSDTTLNLFYGCNIQMFSHYTCFIVKMELLYICSTPQQEERNVWKEISHYIKLIVAEFSLYTHSLPLPYFSFLSFRTVSYNQKRKCHLN